MRLNYSTTAGPMHWALHWALPRDETGHDHRSELEFTSEGHGGTSRQAASSAALVADVFSMIRLGLQALDEV